jgi:pimeloyl-ACP methyl ester carboxylesterase
MRESARRLFKGYPTVGASEEQLRSLAVPVLVIPGDDPMHPRSVGETIASLVADSRLLDLPHHGLVPQRFVREVSAFIAMCESRHARQQEPP